MEWVVDPKGNYISYKLVQLQQRLNRRQVQLGLEILSENGGPQQHNSAGGNARTDHI